MTGLKTVDTYDAISLINNSSYAFISGNYIRRSCGADVPKTRYGINISSGCNHNFITNNDLFEAGVSGAILDNGTGNIIKNNRGHTTKKSGSSTGTGAQQTIAHGLATTPAKVILWNIENGANPYQGSAASGTNIYITAGSAIDYGWEAEVL